MLVTIIMLGLVVVFIAAGIRIIRPTEVGLIERLGKYTKEAKAGFHWIIPIIDKMYRVNVTEQMDNIDEQIVITKDKLNAKVDAVVYFKVSKPYDATYNVDDYKSQLTSLAQTTLRAVIGTMSLAQANEERNKINKDLFDVLEKEAKEYGVSVLRVELQEIEPPRDVQDAMNEVVKAEQKKIAATDLATAFETQADGKKRAAIKEAEGVKQAAILKADGEAKAIEVVNTAAEKYFIGNAQKLKAYETFENSFKTGTKIVVDPNSNMINVMNEMAGVNIIPTKEKKKQ